MDYRRARFGTMCRKIGNALNVDRVNLILKWWKYDWRDEFNDSLRCQDIVDVPRVIRALIQIWYFNGGRSTGCSNARLVVKFAS